MVGWIPTQRVEQSNILKHIQNPSGSKCGGLPAIRARCLSAVGLLMALPTRHGSSDKMGIFCGKLQDIKSAGEFPIFIYFHLFDLFPSLSILFHPVSVNRPILDPLCQGAGPWAKRRNTQQNVCSKDEAHWGSKVLRWGGFCRLSHVSTSEVSSIMQRQSRQHRTQSSDHWLWSFCTWIHCLGSGCATGTAVLCNDLHSLPQQLAARKHPLGTCSVAFFQSTGCHFFFDLWTYNMKIYEDVWRWCVIFASGWYWSCLFCWLRVIRFILYVWQ